MAVCCGLDLECPPKACGDLVPSLVFGDMVEPKKWGQVEVALGIYPQKGLWVPMPLLLTSWHPRVKDFAPLCTPSVIYYLTTGLQVTSQPTMIEISKTEPK
jgi:hypothetical protein